jgi:hypothetical protein
MQSTMTTRRTALVLTGFTVLAVLLITALATPAQAAPRTGITAARGVAAEARATPAGATFSTHPLGPASIAAPLTRSESYGVMPWAAAWLIGAIGAVVLIGGARAFALAQRRGRGGRVAELTGSGAAPGDTAAREDRRRKAA